MDTDEMWVEIDRARTELVSTLADLTPEQWATPSLCDGWTVRDVAGHLTMLGMSTIQLAGLATRHPGGTNALIRNGSRTIARRSSTAELTTKIRALIGNRHTFPWLGVAEVHLDILAHTLDITQPLGIDPGLPVAHLEVAADNTLAVLGGRKGKVFARLPLERVTLRADDTGWTHGAGPEVSGRMQDLFLVVTGRRAGLDGVTGPGVAALR